MAAKSCSTSTGRCRRDLQRDFRTRFTCVKTAHGTSDGVQARLLHVAKHRKAVDPDFVSSDTPEIQQSVFCCFTALHWQVQSDRYLASALGNVQMYKAANILC